MQGVPEQFSDERDSARFRHLAQVPGVELYHAHISRYAFEPHTHEAFGIGAIELGAERFRYRGSQYVAAVNSIVTMNPDELHTGEAKPPTAGAIGWSTSIPRCWKSNRHAHWCQRSRAPGPKALATALPSHIRPVAHDDPLASRPAAQPYRHLSPVCPSRAVLTERPIASSACANICTITICARSPLMSCAGCRPQPVHFQRQFKAHFHVTPHQMLMAIRLWRAKAFLTHGMPPPRLPPPPALPTSRISPALLPAATALPRYAIKSRSSGANAQSHTIFPRRPPLLFGQR
ncbi:AraC-like ligand binding domain [Raoultella terrigena]|uniref:AraC-like ligand binding domain n=1 Tax=Raoultella terrigena TaxID=577 RepID=A0A4U9D4Q6_RAOTE|nr:AraC-like ligand binding domain [Raoultella terrigena]